ncbi:MAG: L-aspartate oxidase [Planctomycetes bacterium]|nr:L-aspartate oxidase [Planctomycetota bacterium]
MQKHLEPRRYLKRFDSQNLPHVFCDVLVIGSGVAGLSAAINASEHAKVLVVTKDAVNETNTDHAQGGIAVVLAPDDKVEAHVADTLATGQGLCDEDVVKGIVAEGPMRIRDLISWGAEFDTIDGALNFTREGGHGHPRIIHAHGDATGAEVQRALVQKAAEIENINVIEKVFVIDLLTAGGRCFGALTVEQGKGPTVLWASKTILATGGAGRLYRETTNPPVATGDGLAMAYRAGATLRDMEFFQFHPTTLYVAGASRALITETVRGEGGLLRNALGERFMPNYHPKAELAPRDVVSRSIVHEMWRTRKTCVYIDMTHLPKEKTRKRFPRIVELCANFDIDICEDQIPVRPSAHYMVGGALVDAQGRTGVEDLYACGEVTSTGLHGANRLGSNSLLEGLVYGCRAGEEAGRLAAKRKKRDMPKPIQSDFDMRPGRIDIEDVRNSLRSLVWRNVGIERAEPYLGQAEDMIDFWCSYVMCKEFDSPAGWELQNLLTIAKIVASSARWREETRGVHYRTDFPERDDQKWLKHSLVHREAPDRK